MCIYVCMCVYVCAFVCMYVVCVCVACRLFHWTQHRRRSHWIMECPSPMGSCCWQLEVHPGTCLSSPLPLIRPKPEPVSSEMYGPRACLVPSTLCLVPIALPLSSSSPSQIPDYLALDDLVGKVESIVVVGGGFLGSELAVALASRGEWVWPQHGWVWS